MREREREREQVYLVSISKYFVYLRVLRTGSIGFPHLELQNSGEIHHGHLNLLATGLQLWEL